VASSGSLTGVASRGRGGTGLTPRARGGLARLLLAVFLPLSLIPLGAFAVLVYQQVRAQITEQVSAQLTSLANLKLDQVEQWATTRVADVRALARTHETTTDVQAYLRGEIGPESIRERFQNFLNNNRSFEAIMLARATDGAALISTRTFQYDQFEGQTFLDAQSLAAARVGAAMFPPHFEPRVNDVQVLVAGPVLDYDGQVIALVYGFVRDEQLLDIVAPTPGLGLSGRAYMVTRDGYQVSGFLLAPGALPESLGLERARMQQQNGQAIYRDPNGVEVLGAYRWLPFYQMALLVEQSTADAYAPLNRFVGVLAALTITTVALSALAVVFFTGRITGPLRALTEVAMRMAGGDLAGTVPVQRNDEIGLLAEAFNGMSAELRGLYADLERKVEARTQQLEAAAEVGRAATSILSTEELLRRAVDLIRDRFGYYHVSVFLLDEAGRYAIVREGTGEVGAQMKARGHRLAVGSQSLIGWVTANRRARIALDVGGDEVYFQNELLPETRSEAALPLIVGDRLIGALDVQSRALRAFSQADVEVLQVLADQLAVAIENGRLFARQQRVAQLEQQVAGLTARIHGALSLDGILDHTANGLGQVFHARRVVVRLAPEAEANLSGAAPPGNGGRAVEPAPTEPQRLPLAGNGERPATTHNGGHNGQPES
jgi:GAF domain-containing protein/HAMP domain-containing protein